MVDFRKAAAAKKAQPQARPQPKAAPTPKPQPKAQMPSTQLEYDEEDAGLYHEGMDAGAYALPFVGILQALSPAVQKGTPEFIEGAESGLLLNSLTKEISDEMFITVLKRGHTICRWIPREDGGGFVGQSEADVDALVAYNKIIPDDKKRRIDKEGIEWTEHRDFYCVQYKDDGRSLEPIIISMTKSQLTPARKWNSLIDLNSARTATGKKVLNSTIWIMRTQLIKRGENQWYSWAPELHQKIDNMDLYNKVRELTNQARDLQITQRALEQLPDEEASNAAAAEM